MSESPNILVVGSINMDLAVRSPHLPSPGETVLGDQFTMHPGGKGANQAVAAARLGASVRMIGRVGDDAFGKSLRENLQNENVCVDHVLMTENTPTGTAMVVVDNQGENSIIVAGGANFRVTPDDVFSCESCFEQADVVLLQLELPCPTVRAAIDLARRKGCRIILDPAPAHTPFPDELCHVDILSPNVTEAETLTGKKAIEERLDKQVATDLIARGAKNAILKLGPRGSLVVCSDGHFYRVKPYKVNVVDTTAAGDAFTAALAVSIGRGLGHHAAAKFANAAGALACSKLGALSAMPRDFEVKMLMDDQPL
jgi:ribokinase